MASKKSFTCACGNNKIELSFHHSMPPELIDVVYCPTCPEQNSTIDQSWPIPGGWRLHFNLDVARMFAMAKLNINPQLVNPGFVIDGGYVE